MKFKMSILTLITMVNIMNTAESKTINVLVNNIDTTKPGNILVMLFSKSGFPKEHSKTLDIKITPATYKKVHVSFSSVPEEFAIKVLHDEDETGTVTKNWTGIIPAEGLAFSNGAKLSFGPPSFKKAKLNLSKITNDIEMYLIYP